MGHKLLIVSTTYITLRAFLLPYARHFRALGWQVDGLASGASACPECGGAFNTSFDIEWTRNPGDLHAVMRGARRVREIVTHNDYDIIHVHTPVAAFVTRYALRNRPSRQKIVYTAHGFHFHEYGRRFSNFLFRGLERLAGRWTDHLVVINREDEQEALRFGLVPAERLTFLPGVGVDLAKYSAEKVSTDEVAALRRSLGVQPEETLLLMIAEFLPGKRHADALAALKKLNRRDVHLALAGTGPGEASIRDLRRRLGLESQVHMLGYRRDIPQLLAAANGFLLPSEREGLPRSMLEAMALGVPLIGTDIRGVRDLLAHGAGLRVPVGDVSALANAMAVLADDSAKARAMGDAARRAVQEYSIDKLLRLHEQLYARVLASEAA